MKLLRAALFGILLWILIFFEVSILMFGFGLSTGVIYYTIHYILLILLVGIASLIYFRKAKAGFSQGILAGVIFSIVGIILDAAITVPLFTKSYSFFINTYLWLGIIETIVLAGIFGAIKKK